MNGHDTSPTRPADENQIISETKLKMTEKADPDSVQNSDLNRNEKTDSLEDSVDGNSKTTISTDVEEATKIAQMSFETLERELEENEVETSNSEAVKEVETPSEAFENANKSDDGAEKMDTEDATVENTNDKTDNDPVAETADSAETSDPISQTPVAEEEKLKTTVAEKSDSEKKDKSENMDNSVNDDAMDLFDLGEQVLEKYAKPESPKGDGPPIKLRIRRSAAEIRSEVVAERSSSSSAESPAKTPSLDSPAQTSSPRRRGRPPKKRPLDDEFVSTDEVSPVKKRGPRGPYKKKNLNESSTSEVSDIENSQNVSPYQSPQREQSTRPKRAAAEKAVREVIERSFELLEKEAFEFQPEPFFKKHQKKEREEKEAVPESPKSPEKRKRGRKPKKLAETHEKSFEELEKEAFEADRRKAEAAEEVATKPVLAVPVVEEQPDQNVQYVPGDMLWSKVAGHPWWPSMVSYDPHKGKYTDMKQRGIRIYHVQYFGPDPERSWVTEKSTMRFLGLDGFEDALFRERKEKFKITPKRMPDWEFAVEEADDALKMSATERKQQLTFVYEDPKKKKQAEREAAKAEKVKAKVPHTPQKKNKISLEKVDKKLKESPNSEPAESELGEPFDRYVSEVLGPMREANPKLALDELQDLLEEGWRKLKPHERTKYQAVGDLPEKKRRKRSRKPSSKAREMEEEEDVDVEAADEDEEEAEEEPPPVKATKPRKRKPRDSIAPEDAPEPKKAKKEEKRKSEVERRKSESESEKKEDEVTEKKKKRQKSPLTISDEQALEITKLSNSGPSKKESVCAICEKAGNGEMVICSGQCLESYHVTCLGEEEPIDNFKCEQCTTGEHVCFVCKVQEPDLQKCSVVQCGKFYHLLCVKAFNQTRVHKSFICPLHCCSSCFVDNPAGLKAFKGRLVKCLRCPSAYHTGDFCASAGSEPVAGFYIICPKHFVPKRTKSHHAHCNVNWCFQCSKGGILICCEACPGAYHSDCLEEPPSARSAGIPWFCPDCSRGREPMYGEIVWVKLGNYRWWPAEICHPKNVPDNVQDIPHQAGEFPVRFYGSKDYYWTHRGRIFQFQEGDQGGSSSESAPRPFAVLFRRAVVEATAAYQQWRKTKCDQEKQASDKKPAPFKFIKTNIAVGSIAAVKPDMSEIARCECKSDAQNPCGPDSDCVNRMLWYECHPAQCPAGSACQNQRFQQRIYPEQSVFKTAKHGWGLKAMVDIKKGEFVNEYVGELIDEEECRRRIDKAHDENITNFYMLTIEKDRIIDAGPKGNYSRFMNHSCDPNCETQKWTINGEVRVGLFAKTDLSAGTELTFNYNLECLGDDKTVCECGSDNCSGYLGVRPKPNHSNGQKSSTKKKKRRKPKIKDDGHEDECWRCGDGGDLVMCDRGSCPKAYHLSCLGLDKMPHGKWDCPWHHCDECGGRADRRCDECPNSFCLAHSTPDLVIEFPAKCRTLCTDHEELIEAYKSGKCTPEDSDASSVTSEQTKGDLKRSTNSSNKKEAKEVNTGGKSGKKKDSELGMGPVLQLPKGMSIKRTVNALLSSKHGKVIERGTPKGKKGRPPVASKKEEVQNQSESEDDEEIPGFKLKTTARRDMQKTKRTQSQKRKRTSTGQKEGKKKGPKPRKRARLGAGDGDDSDEFPESDLVIDA